MREMVVGEGGRSSGVLLYHNIAGHFTLRAYFDGCKMHITTNVLIMAIVLANSKRDPFLYVNMFVFTKKDSCLCF